MTDLNRKHRNIADPSGIERDRQDVRLARQKELNDIRAVLSLPEGKRFILRILNHCGVAHTVWTPSAAIHRNAGSQDVGHFIVEEVLEADEISAGELLVRAYQHQKGVRS